MAYEEQDFVDGWQTYSNWIDNLRDTNDTIINDYDENPDFKRRLLSCETTRDKFKLIWTDQKLKSELETCYKRDSEAYKNKRQMQTKKSSEESNRMRQLGNASFKNSNYLEALNEYTQAIKYSPFPNEQAGDKSLAFAFANRSAVLYALTRYRLCLLDIDLAVKYGYPQDSMFKLLIRKVKCLHILSVWTNDVEQIKEDLKNMIRQRDTSKVIVTEIQSMFEFLQNSHPEEMPKDELDVVDETLMKISNVSKTVSQAADCVEMVCNKDQGRCLMINKDVTFGRLLLAEEPFVCNLAVQKRSQHCYNCFGSLYSCGICCRNCTEVMYCSEACLESRDKVHSRECGGFIDYQEKLGVAYIVAHIMFKIDFNLKSFPIHTKKTVEYKSLDDIMKISLNDWTDLVYKNDYTAVLSLMDHIEDYDYDELMSFTLTAAYLMIAFIDRFSESEPQLLDPDSQLVMGSILLKHLLQLQTNLISVLTQNLQSLAAVGHKLADVDERPIGIGIYPTVSLLNHSCTPNILSIFHRNRFIARAAKTMECGSEINYCYGPSVSRMSKKDRQRRLKEQYFFTCQCDSCASDKENENRALLCPHCDGPVIYNQDYTNNCLKCKAEDVVDVKSLLEKVDELRSAIENDFNTVGRGQLECKQEINRLVELEKSLHSLVYWRNPLFVTIKSKLQEMAEGCSDLDMSLKYCEEEFELCCKTFGEHSYESLMIMLKVINKKWRNLYYTFEESEDSMVKRQARLEMQSLITTVNSTRGKLKDLLASTNIIGAEASFDSELKFLAQIYNSINSYLDSFKGQPKGPSLEDLNS